jgi:hypothetical protein
MAKTTAQANKALVLEAFDTLFNKHRSRVAKRSANVRNQISRLRSWAKESEKVPTVVTGNKGKPVPCRLNTLRITNTDLTLFQGPFSRWLPYLQSMPPAYKVFFKGARGA